MFDKIKFDVYITPVPLSTKIIDGILSQSNQGGAHEKLSSLIVQKTIAASSSKMQNLDFCINGKVESFNIPPISQYAKDHLYYLTDFSIFHLSDPSFTTRSYYPKYILLYTYHGYGSLQYNGKTYHLGEGDGFLIDGRKPHTYRCTGDQWIHAIANVEGNLMEELYQRFIENGSPVFTQPFDGFLQQGLDELLHIYSAGQPYRDWQASACIDSFMTKLLVQSLEDSTRSITLPQNMQYLIRYIENNYLHPLSMDYLSDFSGVSRAHLTREFKKYTGYTPNAYIIQLRLGHAKKLLGSHTIPISTVAYDSGFHDINNFINLFKKDTGMTPGAYRKQFL